MSHNKIAYTEKINITIACIKSHPDFLSHN